MTIVMTRTQVTGATRQVGRHGACSPIEYAKRYHNLVIRDPAQKLNEIVNITRYQNGVRDHTTAERAALFNCLEKILKIGNLPPTFRFPVGDVMGCSEQFYKKGLERAYNGKGSPVEMEEALRLAYRCGRIGPKTQYRTLTEYARNFLGLDCNGFVGNFWGLSPALSIGVWAIGEPGKLLDWSTKQQRKSGWGAAELASTPYIPLAPIHDAKQTKVGDILITTIGETKYKHIATIDRVSHLGGDMVKFTIVEWGSEGDEASHIRNEKVVTLVPGKNKKYGLGFPSKDKFRYLFAGPNTPFLPATWGRCNQDDI